MASVSKLGWRLAGLARSLSTASASSSASPIVELREYDLIPAQAAAYIAATRRAAPVRHRYVPTRLCSVPVRMRMRTGVVMAVLLMT